MAAPMLELPSPLVRKTGAGDAPALREVCNRRTLATYRKSTEIGLGLASCMKERNVRIGSVAGKERTKDKNQAASCLARCLSTLKERDRQGKQVVISDDVLLWVALFIH
eukprot:1144419-Pelagomonas_calceolata.AAC.8